MTNTRESMIAALKTETIPTLRELGFKGSYPHYYRDRNNHIDLLTFQSSMYGGRFTVEISYTTPTRQNLPLSHTKTPTPKLRTFHTNIRKRLGAEGFGDHWFIYDQPIEKNGEISQEPATIALQVSALLRDQGENWWAKQRVGN